MSQLSLQELEEECPFEAYRSFQIKALTRPRSHVWDLEQKYAAAAAALCPSKLTACCYV